MMHRNNFVPNKFCNVSKGQMMAVVVIIGSVIQIVVVLVCSYLQAKSIKEMNTFRVNNDAKIRSELLSLVAKYGDSIKDTESYRYAISVGIVEN